MKALFLVWIIALTSFLNGFSLKDKMVKGAPGEFVVTQQGGTYTVLLIRSLSEEAMVLEEIDAPTVNLEVDKVVWKSWVAAGAPGHTAWISYVIDLKQDKLLKGYSHTREAWLYIDDPNHFLTKLLSLPLEKTPQSQRKKIGPPPPAEEADNRSLWMPSVIFEGKKIAKSEVSAWRCRWPADSSVIAGCEVEIYFSQFTFPYWIEIRSPHYKASIKTVDSGKEMVSPKSLLSTGAWLSTEAPAP
jgi:hypothetical protein